MEESLVYDLLGHKILHKWREEAEKDEISLFVQEEEKSKAELLLELTEKGKKAFATYTIAVTERMDYLHDNLHIKILNLGVKIGMELQKAFTQTDE